MCGYCTERIYIDTVLIRKEPVEKYFTNYPFCLQECQDLLEFLKFFSDIAKEKQIPEDDLLDSLNPHIILCRTLEFLIESGFESEKYTELIQNNFIHESIVTECIDQKHYAETLEMITLPHLSKGYSLKRGTLQDRLNNVSQFISSIKIFIPLYHSQTYFNKEAWSAFLETPGLIKECSYFLECYVDWWLKGNQLKKNSSDEIKKHLKGTHVVFDPFMTISKEERLIFDTIFRVLYFSLLIISKNRTHQDCLNNIVLTPTSVTPFFDAMDLWLQRKASTELFKISGLSLFSDSIAQLRPELLCYLVFKLDIPISDRKQIAKAMKQLNDDYEYYADEIDDEAKKPWKEKVKRNSDWANNFSKLIQAEIKPLGFIVSNGKAERRRSPLEVEGEPLPKWVKPKPVDCQSDTVYCWIECCSNEDWTATIGSIYILMEFYLDNNPNVTDTYASGLFIYCYQITEIDGEGSPNSYRTLNDDFTQCLSEVNPKIDHYGHPLQIMPLHVIPGVYSGKRKTRKKMRPELRRRNRVYKGAYATGLYDLSSMGSEDNIRNTLIIDIKGFCTSARP